MGCGPAEERVLLTGLHAVADIYCENCKTTLGWKYVSHHGDSGPKTGRVLTIKEGPRAGGRGGCAHRTGNHWPGAGRGLWSCSQLTRLACLAPTPGPTWAHRGGQGGVKKTGSLHQRAPPHPGFSPPLVTPNPRNEARADRPSEPPRRSTHSCCRSSHPDARSPHSGPALAPDSTTQATSPRHDPTLPFSAVCRKKFKNQTDSILKPLSLSKEHAFESSQKYKEGKFIIELAHMIKDNGWE